MRPRFKHSGLDEASGPAYDPRQTGFREGSKEKPAMPLTLDHTIVPSRDKETAARFISRILGLEYDEPFGHFQPVKTGNGLSLDFDNREEFDRHHYAFLATDDEFDAVMQRIQSEGVVYGSEPGNTENGEINHRHHGRGVYFRDTDGHIWEVITHTYVRE
jgi:catechol 2,3-dioxygenase-like lactoylglutathione lyase family enzyme